MGPARNSDLIGGGVDRPKEVDGGAVLRICGEEINVVIGQIQTGGGTAETETAGGEGRRFTDAKAGQVGGAAGIHLRADRHDRVDASIDGPRKRPRISRRCHRHFRSREFGVGEVKGIGRSQGQTSIPQRNERRRALRQDRRQIRLGRVNHGIAVKPVQPARSGAYNARRKGVIPGSRHGAHRSGCESTQGQWRKRRQIQPSGPKGAINGFRRLQPIRVRGARRPKCTHRNRG